LARDAEVIEFSDRSVRSEPVDFCIRATPCRDNVVSSLAQEVAMPNRLLSDAYRESRERYEIARREFVQLLERMVVETLARVLPKMHVIEVLGQFNEDWIPILRVQRVLDASGDVLFDAKEGQADRAVEDAVDTVDMEYLDVLIDLTGDEFMGSAVIN
jgi:flavin-dependent dehydrogenase